MSRVMDFLERTIFSKFEPSKAPNAGTVIIDIPTELYYMELAVHTAVSLISNALSRSEIRVFINGEESKTNTDYYLLNVSPNRNETSSIFWHKVINTMVKKKEALVVDAGGYLYCADSFVRELERPILGDVYSGVTIGNLTLDKKFTQQDVYLFKLDDVNVYNLIQAMNQEYGKVLSSAADAFRTGNAQKYKLHIDGVKAGDDEFEKEFEEIIQEDLKEYMSSDSAVYPEYDGYTLTNDSNKSSVTAADVQKLKEDLFLTVAHAFHIPDSMITGNITNIQDIVDSFLSFGVDPFADAITESLNKRGGLENYVKGNRYQVDTGKVRHRDIFHNAAQVAALVSSATLCIDEIREGFGYPPLNTPWSKKYFMTKNFESIETLLNSMKGGEEGEQREEILSNNH